MLSSEVNDMRITLLHILYQILIYFTLGMIVNVGPFQQNSKTVFQKHGAQQCMR